MISKKELKHLASLSRIELTEAEEESFSSDLGKILAHFDELKEVDTTTTKPQTGGSFVHTIVRSDTNEGRMNGEEARRAFPEAKKGFLKVPPVFE
ncbi:MAG: Asp-tRNA(Asn)/Glu-tRNA(Gln) amidotransferase subunit GatC [Candidatus Paceibacterota bacterium]|jgi:aspartyl-tRNA(Asn)/glutamyl-tRNA(Gln) amidotransferase subunit C